MDNAEHEMAGNGADSAHSAENADSAELTLATVADSPAAKADAQLAAYPGSSSLVDPGAMTITRTVDAMRADEIERAHVFYWVIVGLSAAIGLILPFAGGDPTARLAFAVGLALFVAAETLFVRAIRDPRQYNERNLFLLGTVGLFAGYAGVYYFGIFSPAAAVIVMAIYFNSLVGSFRYTVYVYVASVTCQATLSILIATNTIVDPGLVKADHLTVLQQLVTQALVQAAFLATFLIASVSRRLTHTSIENLERAVRDVAQREAIINEARQELERAGGIGDPGRFSEQELGSYRLGVVIGRGAMGEVYDATHVQSGERAAVKLLHRSVLSDRAQVARFAREARVITALRSKHIVRVLQVSDASDAVPFIIMEKLEGCDLGHYLRQRRRFPGGDVIDLVEQVSLGLEAAREKHIVHRDLKPQNIFLTELATGAAEWKILDFGVSKIADASGTLTRGRVVGTPTYMAPEQASGHDVDHRADVYSLGAVVYRAVTGHPPFKSAHVPQIMHAVVAVMPIRPSELCELHADVECCLAIVLAKKPEHRFATAAEFAQTLALAFRGKLADHTRARAAEILADWPWSKRA